METVNMQFVNRFNNLLAKTNISNRKPFIDL